TGAGAEAGARIGQVERAGPGRRLGPSLDDARGRVDAGARLAGAGRRAPAQPGELLAGQVAPGGLGGGGALVAGGAPFEVGVVAADVDEGATPVELEHLGGHAVEHVAVV